jgi:hypothetical protein
MSDKFRFSLPDRPTGTPVSQDEAERILRANVCDGDEGLAGTYGTRSGTSCGS